VVAHLGRNPTVEEALEDWAESQRRFAQHARNLRRGAEFIRAGVKPARYDGNRYKPVYYLPRENQDPNEEPPKQTFGQFLQGWHSDKGFFWHRGSLAELEAEAAAEEKKAAEYRERIVRLKEVVTKEVTPAANS
jgi:hypothetical protein